MSPKRDLRLHAVFARGEAFASAQEAWFWTRAASRARHEGAARGRTGTPRPCDPDDVFRCLQHLWDTKAISMPHIYVLRRWGDAGMPPDPRRDGDRADCALWREALDLLEPALVKRGIVAESTK